jgi:peptide/nickel transport system permease protein
MFFSFWLIAIPGRLSPCWCSPSTSMGDGLRDVTAPDSRS